MGDTLTYNKPALKVPAKFHCEPLPGDSNVVLPSVMMSRVADLVRFIFSDPSNIWHPQIRSMIYSEDIHKSKVAVMMGFSTTPETEQADVFPRIVIVGTDAYFGDLDPITDNMFTNSLTEEGEVFGTDEGFSHHGGQLTLSCASRNPLEALLMAESLAMYFIKNKMYIKEDFCLSSFNVRAVRSPQPAQKPEGVYESQLTIQWSSGMQWVSVEDGPALGDTGYAM